LTLEAAELAGFFAAHAVWCICEGETLIPILASKSSDGTQEFLRIEDENLEAAVARGKVWLEENPESVTCPVLIYDGFIAIAAGETPSPEMVAASGSKEGLRPLVAWGLLTFIIIGLITALAIRDRTALYRRMPFENPPEHLLKLAQHIIDKAGYSEEPVDSAYGFSVNDPLLKYIESSDKSPDRWKNLDANAIVFWYRQSPRMIQAPTGDIGPDNPPLQHAGEVLIMLDTNGRMEKLRCLPPEVQAKTETEPLDWDSFLSEAGLNLSQWT
jgi:hypothetical protein